MKFQHLMPSLAVVVILALGACGGGSPDDGSVASSTGSATPIETVPEETSEPVSPGEDMRIECGGTTRSSRTFISLNVLWGSVDDWERSDCSVYFKAEDFSEYQLTEAEEEALDAATITTSEEWALQKLYGLCATYRLGMPEEPDHWNESDSEEIRNALIVCPNQPEAAEVEEDIDARDSGEVFSDGSYRVGDDIKPGTYVIDGERNLKGCYWERLDETGEIIDNNFMSGGFRVEVTIAASDHSFTSDDCGEWRKQG